MVSIPFKIICKNTSFCFGQFKIMQIFAIIFAMHVINKKRSFYSRNGLAGTFLDLAHSNYSGNIAFQFLKGPIPSILVVHFSS